MDQSEDKDTAAVRFPPPLLPIVTIVGGKLLSSAFPLISDFNLPTPARYWIGGLIIALSILVLGVWPVVQFRRSGQSEIPWTPTPSLIIQGPYRFTRNPMYLMMILLCIGFGVLLSDSWVFALTPVCAWLLYLVAIRHEEAYLERKFGDSYVQYKRDVRRWI
jgi:protein-S-isoprenylcysteine O-methyltransferase Ste14